MKGLWGYGVVAILMWPILAMAEQVPSEDNEAQAMEACLHAAILTAGDDVTVGQLRELCRIRISALAADTISEQQVITPQSAAQQNIEQNGAVDHRLMLESLTVHNPFALTAYKPNYFWFIVD